MSNGEKEVRVPDVSALRATDKAVLVEIEGDEYWIPRSQISEDSDVNEEGDNGDLVINRWFAEKEDIPFNE